MNFPSKCPYCGKDNIPNCIATATDSHKSSVSIHKCMFCNEPIFLIERLDKKQKKPFNKEIISYYPINQQAELQERVKELSPLACKAFEQTLNAKEHGYDMLIGAGLRIALEWLVWDYLSKVKNYHDKYLEKLKLYQRIELMCDDPYKEVCTRLIRCYGNDQIHIKKKLDFTDDEVIEIFKLLCILIDSELQIIEVNDRLSQKS